jgi:hypothetical protein
MINVNIVGYKQFQDSLKKMPSTLRKQVGTYTRAAADQFRELAIKDAPADVVNPGIRSEITVNSISELRHEVVSGSDHSAPMEFGTKGKFTPIVGIDASEFRGKPTGGTFKEMLRNIENWVHRKGIAGTYSVKTKRRTGNKATQQQQNKQAAYLIARSILNKGVTPHPFFFKQIPIVRRDLFRKIRNILND